jgi:hypothetical protein
MLHGADAEKDTGLLLPQLAAYRTKAEEDL